MDKTLVGAEESVGAAIWRGSVNKIFWKIAQDSQENTCAGVSDLETCKLYQKVTPAKVFSCQFCKFLRTAIL